MTDVESLRQRDKEFSIEEKLLCCVWVHDRNINGKNYDDIQRDFEVRFNKKAPKHDLLIMWERNAFSSGSVNFNDNYHMISNGTAAISAGGSVVVVGAGGGSGVGGNVSARIESSPPYNFEAHNSARSSQKSYSNSNSSHSSPNSYQHRSTTASISFSHQPATRRPRPMLHPSPPTFPKNFNPALYKTELCRQYGEVGRCDYGEKCLFAHGKHELKSVPNFRTKVCTSWTYGYCQYGNNCMFIHPDRNSRDGRRTISPTVGMRSNHYHRASKMARSGP